MRPDFYCAVFDRIIAECSSCQRGHAVVEIAGDFIRARSGSTIRKMTTTIGSDDARVELYYAVDDDGSVIGPVLAVTERGGLVSKQALFDLGFSKEIIEDEL